MLTFATTDRRHARTTQALLSAFVSLLMQKRYEEIQTREVAERADVGRSTFYRHFRSKEDLLEKSMQWLVLAIADASLRETPPESLRGVVDHLWANRRLARVASRQPTITNLRRALTAELENRLSRMPLAATGAPASHRAVQIAGAQLAFLDAWLKGELTASRDQAVERLLAVSVI
jgi:AcrR family transcriptional regulator